MPKIYLQESLANAKVSAQQHCMCKGPQRRNVQQINARNTVLKSTFSGFQCCCWQYGTIFIRLALASEMCEILQNSLKIRTSRSSKVIDLGVNRKLIYNFLLVINSNYGRISYRFW